jgi:hypothetical protein
MDLEIIEYLYTKYKMEREETAITTIHGIPDTFTWRKLN